MADKKLPYYRMYPADAETDENFRLLTDEELGFYWRCLNASWSNRGLPQDPEMRSRSLRTDRQEADRKWSNVGRCFELKDGRFVNIRQEKERLLVLQKSAVNSVAGKASAERRFNARSAPVEQQGFVEQRAYDASSCSGSSSLPEVRSIERTEQSSSPKTRRRASAKPKSEFHPFNSEVHRNAFDEFWNSYWRIEYKSLAEKKYIAKIKLKGDHKTLMAAVAEHSDRFLAKEVEFRPRAHNWLEDFPFIGKSPEKKTPKPHNEPEYQTPAQRRAYLESQTGEIQ